MLEAKTAELEQIGTPQWTDSEVARYLRTGEYDSFFVGWPGSNLADIATRASQRLRSALVIETMRRSRGFESVSRLPVDLHAWNSEKLKPMVDGLSSTRVNARPSFACFQISLYLSPELTWKKF